MTTRAEVIAVFTSYADGMEAEVTAAKAETVKAKSDLAALQSDYDALDAEYDAYRASHPDVAPEPTPPTPAPSATFPVGAAVGGNADPATMESRMGTRLMTRKTYYTNSDSEITKAVNHIKDNIAKGRRVSEVSFKSP